MTRLLEFIVALILVFVLAVIIGVLLPSHGHVQRDIELSHRLDHAYDAMNNFHEFPQYAALGSVDPNVQYSQSGSDYGVGSKISWKTSAKMGDGSLEITSDKLDKKIVWKLDNGWKGTSKHYTIHFGHTQDQKLLKVTMAYDVDYGWDLIARYSQLYLHGYPDTFMKYTLGNLQKVLAHIPNMGYDELEPVLIQRPAQPVLLVETEAKLSMDDIGAATNKALDKIHAAIKGLGVKQAGPYYTLTTNYATESYAFSIGVPIDTTELTVGDHHVDLSNPSSAQDEEQASDDDAAADEDNASGDSDEDQAADQEDQDGPGTFDSSGELRITEDVHAKLRPASRVLMATVQGSPAQLPVLRLGLKAFASTHGYQFNEFANAPYDIDASAPDNDNPYDRSYRVYLPVKTEVEQTPWQKDHPDQAAEIISGEQGQPEQEGDADDADQTDQAGA